MIDTFGNELRANPAFYRVLACADAATRVRESNEANNCKASAGRVEIVAAYDPTPFGPVEAVSVDPVVDAGSSVTTRVSAAEGGQVLPYRRSERDSGADLVADRELRLGLTDRATRK